MDCNTVRFQPEQVGISISCVEFVYFKIEESELIPSSASENTFGRKAGLPVQFETFFFFSSACIFETNWLKETWQLSHPYCSKSPCLLACRLLPLLPEHRRLELMWSFRSASFIELAELHLELNNSCLELKRWWSTGIWGLSCPETCLLVTGSCLGLEDSCRKGGKVKKKNINPTKIITLSTNPTMCSSVGGGLVWLRIAAKK